MSKVICDECGEEIDVHAKVTRYPDGGEVATEPINVTAFICPFCRRIYVTSVMTDKMQQEAKTIERMRANLSTREQRLRNRFTQLIKEEEEQQNG